MFLHRNKRGSTKYFGKVITRHDIYSDINLGRILRGIDANSTVFQPASVS
jgi:hypothetical protein